jgi:hypothetical protein
VEEAVNGRAVASGIRLGELDGRELCDLIFFWLLEGKDEAEQMKTRGMFELPPKGYRGDTAGTAWDPNVMAAEFGNGESFNEGEV